MNIRDEITGLSPWVYFWFAVITLLWLLSFIWMWQFSLCCSLFSVPFILFIRWWYKNRMHCSLDHVLKPFLHGYVNITLLSIFGQFIGLLIITAIFAATQIVFHEVGYLFYLIIAITFYVFIEEILKLYFSLKSRDSVRDPLTQINKSHTITSTATGLGYSMASGCMWTAFVAFELQSIDNKKYNDTYSLFGWLFLITLIIAIIGMPMHLITGYIMGCKITQRDIEYARTVDNDDQIGDSPHDRLPFKSYVKVIYYAIFIRAAYLFFLMIGFLVLQFSIIGVIVALVGIVLDYVLLIKHAKKIESQLPFDYLQRVGQLSIFGYNVLNDGPDTLPYDDVPITAMALNNFSTNYDDPMTITNENSQTANNADQEDEEMQYRHCNINLTAENSKEREEVFVPHNILSGSSSMSERSDTDPDRTR